MDSLRSIPIKNILLFSLVNYALTLELPEEYDVRDHYNCKSFYDIRNQGEIVVLAGL